jgi:hypothetical protein
MLDCYRCRVVLLEKLLKDKKDLSILDYIEYLKYQVRMMEDEVECWNEYFGRLP